MSGLPKMVIVGGSLTGLTVAGLCQEECDVIILEQNNAIYSRKHDGGMSLGAWGQKIFEKHIPAHDLLNRAIRSDRLLILSPDDDEMAPLQKRGGVSWERTQFVPKEHRVAMTTWAAVYEVLLRNIAIESENIWEKGNEARPRLRLGAKVEGAQYEEGVWSITYRSTVTNRLETETADILVAADGAYSTVRRVTSPDMAPNYEKVVAWRGRVPDEVLFQKETEIDTEIKKGLLVWYKMRGFQYIILYAVPILGSTSGDDDTVIEWCWYHPYEQGTDPELEAVMTTFADQERLMERRAKKWKEYLEASRTNVPKSIWEMLSRCETPWITKVIAAPLTTETTAADAPDEDTDDEAGDQSSNMCASLPLPARPLFAGEAYAPLPPYLGSTFEPGAEHA
ncbi:hypothetical protein TW65_09309, partial [Stemphylium lycopersici]